MASARTRRAFAVILPALVLSTACAGCKRGGGGATTEEIPPGAVPVAPGAASGAPSPEPPSASPAPASAAALSAPLSFAPIARKADPSVVTITTIGEEEEQSPFFGRARRHETRGLGTGFVIDKDGIILTNFHVVEGAQDISVKLSDEREFPATIVGTDKSTDIAVIRIPTKVTATLALGDSDVIEVGDWVVAIGNPLGLSHTVSAGIISAKGRTREDNPSLGDPTGYYNFMQTDAAINPGNSGGPLLDMKGQVVGMNTAIANPQQRGGAQNIGFAIPINMVKQLLPMLLRDGHVTRSALGVNILDVRELGPEIRTQLKLPDEHGTVIMAVAAGGPAEKAGLQEGDVILAFDGEAVDRASRLKWLASTAGVGRAVSLRVVRAGKTFDLKVTLGLSADTGGPRRGQMP
jgi:serine protease Do